MLSGNFLPKASVARVVLSRRATKSLLGCKKTKDAQRLRNAIAATADSPQKGPNVKHLSNVPGGFRKRVGRFRILYTFHPDQDLVRIWIIEIEKDTKKDYAQWMAYILKNL